jgi:hypothetical protein
MLNHLPSRHMSPRQHHLLLNNKPHTEIIKVVMEDTEEEEDKDAEDT